MLPQRTTFLIVGAGPTGLTCAISLVKQGCKPEDIVIVDAVLQGQNTSRAMAIHAATLESLDTVGCATPLVELGIKANELAAHFERKKVIAAEFSYLSPYTRYPFMLILPQNVTERILGEQLEQLGVRVLRPHRVIGMATSQTDRNAIDVTFEAGEVLQARYVVGADGARSIVRSISGIGFADPDGDVINGDFGQLVVADITFSSPPVPSLRRDQPGGFASSRGGVLLIPLPGEFVSGPSSESDFAIRSPDVSIYRFVCNVPPRDGLPPPNPQSEYIQAALDKYGPKHLSSNPSINPNPVHITETIWSSRFRAHAAIADRFFTRLNTHTNSAHSDQPGGGIVFLVGDAAHIHSPAGGQGMNLGIRDAVGLAPVLKEHSTQNQPTSDVDKILRDYAATRHERAIAIIRLTKRLQGFAASARPNLLGGIIYLVLTTLGRFSFIRGWLAWRLSGLATR